MLGFHPLSSQPLGTAGLVGAAATLGGFVSFGSPASQWSYEAQAASMGYIASFGSHVGIPNVHYPESLGSVITIGHPTTPGDVTTEPETVGYVARFGHPIAIKFKRRAIA